MRIQFGTVKPQKNQESKNRKSKALSELDSQSKVKKKGGRGEEVFILESFFCQGAFAFGAELSVTIGS